MATTCCPPGAIGAASFDKSQKPKGRMVTLSAVGSEDSLNDVSSSASSRCRPNNNIECYQIGPSKPKYIIVVFSDVFGIDSGNQKVFCDHLQQQLLLGGGGGEETVAVWMPDLFRGNPLMKNYFGVDVGLGFLYQFQAFLSVIPFLYRARFQMKVSDFQQDLLEIIEPNIKSIGSSCVENVGCIGFCFGGWVVAQALALNNGQSIFSVGVGIHPSWKPEIIMPGGTTQEELGERTKNKPILFLPAKQDVEFHLDGDIIKQLAQQRAVLPKDLSVVFDEMDHGFVARGNPDEPTIKEAQGRATNLVSDFFKKHFKIS